ncbi:hypothetical protein [Candidatus Odyssella thessalonicensis]|uniref:hypothetical protein n=1 Tax=Candidatus Odyssella thessalonicensis TaxID=84647 RepID=UPI000225AC99|nr:hypothetical protein [Candidatus Odyssella thessalonicensis]
MLKAQIIKIIFAINLVSFGAYAGLVDDSEKHSFPRGGTTVEATAYDQAIWLGETASYAQAVGVVEIEKENGKPFCSVGTAIAPNLVLTTAHTIKDFYSGVFIFNFKSYNIKEIALRPSQLTLKHKPIDCYDIAILHLESSLPLENFPLLCAQSDAQLFPPEENPEKCFIDGWCVSGEFTLRSNYDSHPKEYKRHVTYAKLHISPPNDPYRYYSSKYKTAKNLPQIPIPGTDFPLLPAYEVDKDAHFLLAPLGPGDSGSPFFIEQSAGQYKLAAICSQGILMNSLDLENRIFWPNEEFCTAFTTINYHLNWLRKILKKYNAQAYQPELFALKQA